MVLKKTLVKPAEQPPPGFKLRHTLQGHKRAIYRIAWAPDGRRIASPSEDKSIRLWDTDKGKLCNILTGHNDWVYCVAWSPDCKMLASASADNSIRLWDTETGAELYKLKEHDDRTFSVTWSPDGKMLASSSKDGDIIIWDLEKGEKKSSLGPDYYWVNSIAWSPDGQKLAAGDGLNNIRVWDTATWMLEKNFVGHFEYVVSISWAPDGRTLASASFDGTVRLWDTITGDQIRVLKAHRHVVKCVSFSSDGSLLASKSDDDTVLVWRWDKGKIVANLREVAPQFHSLNNWWNHTKMYFGDSYDLYRRWPSGLAFHPNAMVLATLGNQDRDIRIWEIDLNTLFKNIPINPTVHYTNAKIVLVGESSTGKTCLARALIGKPFKPQESTHGMKVWNFHSETIDRDDGDKITRETLLWDLAGQVDYQVVHQLFLDETVLGLVMFDPTNPINPFKGVGYWEKALRRVVGEDCPRLLLAGRVDRGHPAATAEDIEAFRRQYGYQQFIATSAKTGQGVKAVREAIRRTIPWERLPITSSPELWQQSREYLLQRRDSDEILTQHTDLQKAFRQRHYQSEFSEAEFDTMIRHAQAQGLIWRLSFGGFILLKPELLNDYAAAIVRAARQQAKGLGCVAEQDVLQAQINFEDLPRLMNFETERSLLHAVVELFLQRELALRESEQLVFPSKFNRQRPDNPEHQPREVAYYFSGSVEEIYATLVVRLFYCGSFALKGLWKDAAEFYDSLDNLCGFSLNTSSEGQGLISVFFADSTPDSSKVLFLRFIHQHIHRQSLSDSVRRERIYRCLECGEEVENQRAIDFRLKKGLKTIPCQFCNEDIELIDALESKFVNPELLLQIRKMEQEVIAQRSHAVGITVAQAKTSVGEFDIFLAHNNVDKPQVEAIGQTLRQRGLNPWLDKEQIPPGRWFQDVIQQAIHVVKSAAIFIGPTGLGRWEIVELRSFISQCVDRDLPVIPVLLPSVTKIPMELVFLNQFNRVKFNTNIDDPKALDDLMWGVTGKHPRR